MLIEESMMSDFGDYVAGLGKYNYRQGFFFLDYAEFFTRRRAAEDTQTPETPQTRTGEEADHAASVPVVPSGYERFLKRPIEANITAVGKRQMRNNYSYENADGSGASYARASLTFVTVNAGAARGLKRGMFLHVVNPAEGDVVRIIRVGRQTSNGVLIRILEEGDAETFYDDQQPRSHSKVAAGWKLTTSPF